MGQATIPVENRERLGLKAGDRLRFVIGADGQVVVMRANIDIRDLKGMFPAPERRLSLEEMDEAIAEAVRERVLENR